MFRKQLSGILAFLLLFQLFPLFSFAEKSQSIADIANHWAKEEITSLMSQAIIDGIETDGHLSIEPDRSITRAEYVALLTRALNIQAEQSTSDHSFIDTKGHWAEYYIETAKKSGIVDGYEDGSFQLDRTLTRAELSTMIVRAYKVKTNETVDKAFVDVPSSHWAAHSINTLSVNGIVSGYEGNLFKPEAPATRAESMVMIYRILKDKTIADVNIVLDTKQVEPGETVKITLKEQVAQGFTFEVSGKDGQYTVTNDIIEWKLPKKDGDYSLKVTFFFKTVLGETKQFVKEVKMKVVSSNQSAQTNSSHEEENGSKTEIADFRLNWADGKEMGDIADTGELFDFAVKHPESITEAVYYYWDVTGGTVKDKGDGRASWRLPSHEGKFTISVKASTASGLKSYTLSKTFKVMFNEQMFGLQREGDDYDNDGILNDDEIRFGTDPYNADTDNDGIEDYAEIFIYHTNPLLADTDGDGIPDGLEIALSLDPLNPDSNGDGIPDGLEHYAYVVSDAPGVTATVYGNYTVANTYAEIYNNPFLENSYGMASPIYEFSASNAFDQADLEFSYSKSDILRDGLSEEKLSVYYLNEDEKRLELIPSLVNSSKSTVTATVYHFSKYMIADSSKINTNTGSLDIIFVLDNSGSMFTNDRQDKRLDAAQNIISGLKGDYRFAAVSFNSSTTILEHLTTDKESIKTNIESLRNTADWGTNIGSAINDSIDLFDNSERRKVIVLLTDGDDYGLYRINKAVSRAKEKSIQIYTIGLGEGVNKELLEESISKVTGGKYYYVDNAEKIIGAFNAFATNIDFEKTSISIPLYDNGSVEIKGTVLAKSMFDPLKNGYNFANNLRTVLQDSGMCQGFAVTTYYYFDRNYPFMHNGLVKDSKQFPGYNTSKVDGFSQYVDLINHENSIATANNDSRKGRVEQNGVRVFNKETKENLIAHGFTITLENNSEVAKLDTTNKTVYEDESIAQDFEVIKSIQLWWAAQKKADRQKVHSINEIVSEINDHGTALINFFGKYGHAVNAFQVIKDADDSNVYWLLIYDNNYPGETRPLKLTRKKSFWTKTITYEVDALDYTWDSGPVEMYHP